MVFEDLHWIDSETQAFLDSLIESLPLTRILLLVDYRPEYSHGWGDKTYYTQLRVDPLQSASAEELLQHLLGRNKDLAPLNANVDQSGPKGIPSSLRKACGLWSKPAFWWVKRELTARV